MRYDADMRSATCAGAADRSAQSVRKRSGRASDPDAENEADANYAATRASDEFAKLRREASTKPCRDLGRGTEIQMKCRGDCGCRSGKKVANLSGGEKRPWRCRMSFKPDMLSSTSRRITSMPRASMARAVYAARSRDSDAVTPDRYFSKRASGSWSSTAA